MFCNFCQVERYKGKSEQAGTASSDDEHAAGAANWSVMAAQPRSTIPAVVNGVSSLVVCDFANGS